MKFLILPFQCLNRCEILFFLKKKIEDLNLPILDRKWSKIENPSYKYKKSKETKEQILKLRNEGLKFNEISLILNLSNGYISRILKDYKK